MPQAKDPISVIELAAPGMVCEGCAERVRTALKDLPGVRKVTPKLWRKRVQVRCDPNLVTVDQLTAALLDAGYEAEAL